MQIVNWRTHLKFPEEAKLSPEAKDLISRLLCNVDQRLGTKGADEIKVLCGVFCSRILWPTFRLKETINLLNPLTFCFRLTHGSKALSGTNYII